MIDKNTGQLTFGSGKIISPTITLKEIKAIRLSDLQEERRLGNGYTHYTIKNAEASGKFFCMIFFFLEEALKSLSFVMKDTPFIVHTGWESWNEQEEREKAILYNHWLTKELGTNRTFSWGHVYAAYNPKSGGSSISIRYT